jgi:hypothetical protein
MRRGYWVSMAGGIALLAVSFQKLFQAVDDGAALRQGGRPDGCSAWSTCPGVWPGGQPNALLPWIVGLGVVVALASPVIKRSWWPTAYAGAAGVLLAFTALRLWGDTVDGWEETNYTFTVPPTAWFGLMICALVAIAAGPRWQPERGAD